MRQNKKINEALFQWQDLCTVNITLAIRGNPITLRLSFRFTEGTGKLKSEGCKINFYSYFQHRFEN